jgi:hypothetical protein
MVCLSALPNNIGSRCLNLRSMYSSVLWIISNCILVFGVYGSTLLLFCIAWLHSTAFGGVGNETDPTGERQVQKMVFASIAN